jgi:hypothetical protein
LDRAGECGGQRGVWIRGGLAGCSAGAAVD